MYITSFIYGFLLIDGVIANSHSFDEKQHAKLALHNAMSSSHLRQQLSRWGLSTKGSRDALLERLRKTIVAEHDELIEERERARPRTVVDDSCASGNDGHCDECGFEPTCLLGTDYTDCHASPCFKFTVMKDIYVSAIARSQHPEMFSSGGAGSLRRDAYGSTRSGELKWNRFQELLKRGLKSGDVITSSKVRETGGISRPPEVTEVFYGFIWIKVQIDERVYLKETDYNIENNIVDISNNSCELEPQEESRNSFFNSILFQGLVAYCSCIYYDRLRKGFTFIVENSRILIELISCILMCCMYSVILFSTVSMIFTAVEDRDKEIEVLKIMGLISFIDYFH